MNQKVLFTSHVSAAHRAALESLVFFNSCQTRVLDGIVDAVEKFGPPEIIAECDRLRVRVVGVPEAQCLFAVEPVFGRPIGVAIFTRPDPAYITVLHVGVAEEFASGGRRANEQLLLRMLRKLRSSTRLVKGVRHVELFYLSGRANVRRPVTAAALV